MHDNNTHESDAPAADGLRIGRRGMLAGTLGLSAVGAAITVPLAGCGGPNPHPADQFRSPHMADMPAAHNVRDFGAIGDGKADDTAAIARAVAAGGASTALYLPAGTYRVTSFPPLPDYTTVFGDGADLTTIQHDGDATLIALQDRNRVSLKRLGIFATSPAATAVTLSGCFRCSFDSVVIRGNHLSGNYPKYLGQRGVVLDRNTGGTTFVNCDINNFGTGIVTACIQNYLTASRLTNNYISILGTGNNANAGLSMANVEFVSDRDPKTTSRHIRIDGAANDWWLTNVWFEGADVALEIGAHDGGGPSQFGMVNCKIAARTVLVDLISCHQPYLANVLFDAETELKPIPLRISSTGCPQGTAVNLISGIDSDIDSTVFPPSWVVTARGYIQTPGLLGTVSFRAPVGADLAQMQTPDGRMVASVLGSGAWLCDNPEAGFVLRAPDGGYWRLTIGNDGAVRSVSIGPNRPAT